MENYFILKICFRNKCLNPLVDNTWLDPTILYELHKQNEHFSFNQYLNIGFVFKTKHDFTSK